MNQGKLELEFCWVNVEHTRATFPIQTIDILTFDTGDVDGDVQGTDDAMVTEIGGKNMIINFWQFQFVNNFCSLDISGHTHPYPQPGGNVTWHYPTEDVILV